MYAVNVHFHKTYEAEFTRLIDQAPHRGKQIRKYMVLFSVILLFVVTSITFALVVTTKNTVDDIPTKVGRQVKGLPSLKSMEISLHNLSKSQDILDQGNTQFMYTFMVGMGNQSCQEQAKDMSRHRLHLHIIFVRSLLMFNLSE